VNPNDGQPTNRKQYVFNLTLTVVAGLVGLITLVIILAAVFGGLWLDNHFGTKPLYTLILVIVSMPITLVLMVVIVKNITRKIAGNYPVKNTKDTYQKEEEHFE
jgi:F0F1-type ATP synthase assembly protein I